jgi:hypothetical protein
MYYQLTTRTVLFATTPDALPVVRGWGGDYHPVPVARYGLDGMKALAKEGYTARPADAGAVYFTAAFNAL